jgi:hypothetical protein
MYVHYDVAYATQAGSIVLNPSAISHESKPSRAIR